MNTPLDILLPYQRKWVDDKARFKIGMMSRQSGKSFATASEAVRDSKITPEDMWVVLSAGERQGLEWMEKAKLWSKAFDVAIEDYLEERDGPQTLIKSAEIRFANGSRIISIPANPNTARGYSANLILDEFAFHERTQDIWRAIYPSITNPLKGKKKLRIISTPNGRGNMFYELWSKNNSYSKHKVTIYDAIKAGLQVDAEELKAAIDDPDAWLQEYLCEFIDSASVLLPYDLIAPCETDGGPEDASRRFIGVDVGRRHDLTVIWEVAQVGDVLWTLDVTCLEKTAFHDQFDCISARLDSHGVQRCAIDSNGIGAMLAEELRRKHGDMVIEFTFSNTSKGEVFTNLRRRFEERTVRIPVDREVREDLHAMQKISRNNGMVSYSAPRTSDGHSDRAAALALAVYAASEDYGSVEISVPSQQLSSNDARAWSTGQSSGRI